MPPPSPDDIVNASFDIYNTLPGHGKPKPRSNGIPEWTILATIHLYKPDSTPNLIPISLGTGVKCLPANKLPPLGDVLHDCHAEVLAKRGFARWLIEEARVIASGGEGLGVLEWVDGKFRLKAGVEVWMYVSALPCGDASTLHTAAHQPPEMAALKTKSSSLSDPSSQTGLLRGRNGYEMFGAIRTKPGRTDSQISISMSCSDKMATWCVLGLQGALLGERFEPIYLDGLIVGGVENEAPDGRAREGKEWRDTIKGEVQRALYGRLWSIKDRLSSPYHLHIPQVHLTSLPFIHAKSVISEQSPAVAPVVSGVGIVYIPGIRQASKAPAREVITNGCPQGGSWKAPGLSLISERGRSQICKYNIMRAFLALSDHLMEGEMYDLTPQSNASTYFAMKHSEISEYQSAKAILRGHVVGPAFQAGFEVVGPLCVTCGTKGEGEITPPFQGWLVSGEEWETFNVHGRCTGGD